MSEIVYGVTPDGELCNPKKSFLPIICNDFRLLWIIPLEWIFIIAAKRRQNVHSICLPWLPVLIEKMTQTSVTAGTEKEDFIQKLKSLNSTKTFKKQVLEDYWAAHQDVYLCTRPSGFNEYGNLESGKLLDTRSAITDGTYTHLHTEKLQADGFYWQVFPILTAGEAFIFFISIGPGTRFSRILASVVGIAFVVICWISFAINKHKLDIYSKRLYCVELLTGRPQIHAPDYMSIRGRRRYLRFSLHDYWVKFFMFLIVCHVLAIVKASSGRHTVYMDGVKGICAIVGLYIVYVIYQHAWPHVLLFNKRSRSVETPKQRIPVSEELLSLLVKHFPGDKDVPEDLKGEHSLLQKKFVDSKSN